MVLEAETLGAAGVEGCQLWCLLVDTDTKDLAMYHHIARPGPLVIGDERTTRCMCWYVCMCGMVTVTDTAQANCSRINNQHHLPFAFQALAFGALLCVCVCGVWYSHTARALAACGVSTRTCKYVHT